MATLKISDDLKNAIKQVVLDIYYPVGTYYETSDTNFNPNTAWGGTWKEDSAGRVTVAYDSSQGEFNTVGKTLGSKYLQNHGHGFSGWSNGAGGHNHQLYLNGDGTFPMIGYPGWSADGISGYHVVMNSKGGGFYMFTGGVGDHTHGIGGTVQASGDGNSQNIQPSIVVKRWHRTA